MVDGIKLPSKNEVALTSGVTVTFGDIVTVFYVREGLFKFFLDLAKNAQ